jgi:hypothetical protein
MEWLSIQAYIKPSNGRAVNVEFEATSRVCRTQSVQVVEPCAFASMAAIVRIISAGRDGLRCWERAIANAW